MRNPARKGAPQVWRHTGGDGHGYRYLDNMTESELAERDAMQRPYEEMLARQHAYEEELERKRESRQKKVERARAGCVFAKSCNLPDGVINHDNPGGFVPLEQLEVYGDWAVLGSGSVVAAAGTPLKLIGSSASASTLATRLGGSISLGIAEGVATAGVLAGGIVGTIAMLLPNDTAADSAFYTQEQYNMLAMGRTRVRVNVKQLPDGSVDAYGFYTGGKRDWENVQVIRAVTRGEQFVADLGQGIELIWTPATNPNETLGIPALEGAPKLPTLWVYPPTEQADKILVNPVYPPDYKDAIIWFPAADIQPIYIVLSQLPGDLSYHPAPKGLTAFPDAVPVKSKSSVQGGSKKRPRWKDRKGRIYEWDSQHGAVEMYDKQGKHLGEFDPETGKQTKPRKPSRDTPK